MKSSQNLIPTSCRAKLPRGRSYPVGAEIVSEGLAGVSMYDKLRLSFYRDESSRVGTFLIREGCFVHIKNQGNDSLFRFRELLNIRPPHHSSRIGVKNSSLSDWGIAISSVASVRRAQVRQHLVDQGLPRVREWLLRPRREPWYFVDRFLQVAIDDEVTELCMTEISKDRREWIEIMPLAMI